MIVRIWHGRTPKAKADAYRRFVLDTGVPGYRNSPGNRGVFLLRRDEDDVSHFMLFSLWESYDAIKGYAKKAFGSDDIVHASYFPEDDEYLLELEPTVTHYEVTDLVGLDVS